MSGEIEWGKVTEKVWSMLTIRFTGSAESAPFFWATRRMTDAGTRSSNSLAGEYIVRSF